METLFTSTALYANAAMNPYVGGGMPAGQFQRVAMSPAQRGGVLTQPGLLARLSGTDQSSPVRRGAFVLGTLLCAPSATAPTCGVKLRSWGQIQNTTGPTGRQARFADSLLADSALARQECYVRPIISGPDAACSRDLTAAACQEIHRAAMGSATLAAHPG